MIIVLCIIIDQYTSHTYISALALSQLPHHKGFSASLKISLSYQAVYQYLLDNPVSGPSFVYTVIAALHPSNTNNTVPKTLDYP